jgi:hypothetical protein
MADVNITTSAHPATEAGWLVIGPVWKSSNTGYVVFINSSSNLIIGKTTDGGATWNDSFATVRSMSDDTKFNIWYDKQTPGDSGTEIHIAYMDASDEKVYYAAFDTSTETFAHQDVVVDTFTSIGTTVTAHCISITKAINGDLFIAARGATLAATRGTYRSQNSGTSWSAIDDIHDGTANDWFELFPALSPDTTSYCWGLFWDKSNNDIGFKRFSGSTWSAIDVPSWATVMVESATYKQFSGAISNHDDAVYVTAWNDLNSNGADIVCWATQWDGSAFRHTRLPDSFTLTTGGDPDDDEGALAEVFVDQGADPDSGESFVYSATLIGADFVVVGAGGVSVRYKVLDEDAVSFSGTVIFAAATKKATRSAGTWSGTGFAVGDAIRFANAGDSDGIYSIASLNEDELVVNEAGFSDGYAAANAYARRWGSTVDYSEDAVDDYRHLTIARSTADPLGRFSLVWYDDDDFNLITGKTNSIIVTVGGTQVASVSPLNILTLSQTASGILTRKVLIADDLTVDQASGGVDDFKGCRIVWIDLYTAYFFYLAGTPGSGDGDGEVRYRKTIDGGSTWSASSSVFATATRDITIFDVWYEEWTSGDRGKSIGIAAQDPAQDEIIFRKIDTATGALGSEIVVGGVFNVRLNVWSEISIVKARGGNWYILSREVLGSAHFFKSTDGGDNWISMSLYPVVTDETYHFILNPGDEANSQDVWLFTHTTKAVSSEGTLYMQVYDSDTDTWSAATNIIADAPLYTIGGGGPGASQYSYAAVHRHSDNHSFVAVWDDAEATNELKCWDVAVTGSITPKTSPYLSVSGQGYKHPVSLFIVNRSRNRYIDDIYVVVQKDNTLKYKKSTDGGANWEAEQDVNYDGPHSGDRNSTSNWIDSGHSVQDAGGRFEVPWQDEAVDSAFIDTRTDIKFRSTRRIFIS